MRHKEIRQHELYTGKKLSIKPIPKEALVLNLLKKDFKSIILNIFTGIKETMSGKQKESIRTIPHQINDTNKIIEFYKEPNMISGV